MVRKIIFEDEITLWWEYKRGAGQALECFLNGEKHSVTSSTHVSFTNLAPDTSYKIKIKDGARTVFEREIQTHPAKNRLDVTKAPYFAVGDGKTLNTKALQRALDDCRENDCVYFPKGTFLSGALKMHGDTEVYFDEGCVLQGTALVEDYLPKIKSRFEGIELMAYSSLLNAGELDHGSGANCKNIILRGHGRIVGGGNPLRENVIKIENARLRESLALEGKDLTEYETPNTAAGRFRPRLINVSNTDGFILSGLSIESSPSWNLHMIYSQNLTVYGCAFVSQGIQNGDGIDPDSVENCAIFNCKFKTGDDCIAIKSGKNPEGNVVNRRSANIYVFDCLGSGHGLSIGSEMSGGVENVFIWDCDLLNAYWGVQLKFSKKRGGFIKNVRVNRCKLSYVAVWSVPYNADGEAAPTAPIIDGLRVEDCLIFRDENIYEDTFRYVYIRGIDDEKPVRNVYFNNILVKKQDPIGGAIVIENAENVVFNKVTKID